MPFRDINPAPLNPLAYGDMVANIGANALAGEERGRDEALLMRQLDLDATRRQALSDYLAAPEASRPAALNALVGADPQTAADVLTIENTQRERAAAERRERALEEYTQAVAVLKSENPALAIKLLDADGTFLKQLEDAGLIDSSDGLDDDEARLIATWARDTSAPLAEIEQDKAEQFGLAPQFGVDEAGDPVLLQLSSGGRAVKTAMPAGVTLSRTPIRLDTGTGYTLVDPITRQPVREIEKDVAGEESERVIGEGFGKQYSTMQDAAFTASGTLNRLDRMESLLANIETGKLAGVEKQLGELGEALGVDVEGLGETQAFVALSNELALQMRNPAGGAGMPGAMSDADREFLRSTVPQLQSTQGGNRLIIDYGRRMARRQQEVAARARAYKSRHGSIDENFFDELDEWSAEHPLFEKENALIEVGRSTAPGAPAAAPADPLSALTPEQRAKYGL